MPESVVVAAVGLVLATVALGIRLGIHVGLQPGGVDTWYFLASAAELRRTKRLPIRLPQYLLQDPSESYPPGFIVFLALLPQRWLRRYFWLVSPLVDAAHLLLVYALTLRLTSSLLAAIVAGAVHALTPQLVSETRSLNPRAFGVLLNSITMYLILRSVIPVPSTLTSHFGEHPWYLFALAILFAAAVFLTTTGVAFVVATASLTVVLGDARYLLLALAGLGSAVLLSGGLLLRVLANYVHAVRFWRRNLAFRGLHPILDSPIYGRGRSEPVSASAWVGGGIVRSTVRLVGENPFLVPMLFVATPSLAVEWWGQQMYWWAVAILIWSFAVTFVRPLRVFGPGYQFMKASVMPTAFSLALLIDGNQGNRLLAWVILAVSFALSVAAIGVLYVHLRARRSERTSSTPPGLTATAEALSRAEGDGVLCLPPMYADYVTFTSGKKVLWGGHSGDLSRFEAVHPVIRRPLEELIREYRLEFVLLDLSYTDASQIRLAHRLREISRHGEFALYRVGPAGA